MCAGRQCHGFIFLVSLIVSSAEAGSQEHLLWKRVNLRPSASSSFIHFSVRNFFFPLFHKIYYHKYCFDWLITARKKNYSIWFSFSLNYSSFFPRFSRNAMQLSQFELFCRLSKMVSCVSLNYMQFIYMIGRHLLDLLEEKEKDEKKRMSGPCIDVSVNDWRKRTSFTINNSCLATDLMFSSAPHKSFRMKWPPNVRAREWNSKSLTRIT